MKTYKIELTVMDTDEAALERLAAERGTDAATMLQIMAGVGFSKAMEIYMPEAKRQ